MCGIYGFTSARRERDGVQADAFFDALARLLGDWRDDAVPRIACGMVGSRQGWHEAPYVECPASLAGLSRGLVETVAGGLAIVCTCRSARMRMAAF